MIASHYAEPLERLLLETTKLFEGPDDRETPLAEVAKGDQMRVLDISRGWAWGYAPNGKVGYVRAAAVTG